MIKLADELKHLGYTQDAERFRELLADMLAELHPNWNDEQLMYHPLEARDYCNLIRYRSGLKEMTDELILRSLENMRKNVSVRP